MSIFGNMMSAYDMFSNMGDTEPDPFAENMSNGQGMIESALMEQLQAYGQPGSQAGSLGGMPGSVEVDEMQAPPPVNPFQDLQPEQGAGGTAGGIARMFMGGGMGGMGGMFG